MRAGSLAAAINGACATTPCAPITALPTPEPRLISVAGFPVAMNNDEDIIADTAVPAPSLDNTNEDRILGEMLL
jgi:hypothetical protein